MPANNSNLRPWCSASTPLRVLYIVQLCLPFVLTDRLIDTASRWKQSCGVESAATSKRRRRSAIRIRRSSTNPTGSGYIPFCTDCPAYSTRTWAVEAEQAAKDRPAVGVNRPARPNQRPCLASRLLATGRPTAPSWTSWCPVGGAASGA